MFRLGSRVTGAGRGGRVCLTLAAMVAAGCSGAITERGVDPGGGGGALCSVDPGPSFIRRVTRVEYDNTVRDLLGATTSAAASFPTEEIRLGFNNNASALSVSPTLAEQYLLAAETLAADTVTSRLSKVVTCDPAAMGVDACGAQFIASFGKRAYRRPLTADDVAILTAVFDAGKATDFQTGVRLVIETVLQAPQFLYRVEFGQAPRGSDPTVAVNEGGTVKPTKVVRLDPWETASRLSYMLWRTMPDDALFAAAEAGKLTNAADIAVQVDRMLADPKARAMVGDFHDQWLRVGDLGAVEKDSAVFKDFTPAVAALMQQETQQFLDYVIWDGGGTLSDIFTAPFTFVNGPLATYYGIPGVTGTAFTKVDLDPGQRAGLLTQGGLLSLLAKANQTSPVHRGKFVREQLLCQQLPPPPPDIEIKPPDLSPTLTTRERFTQHATDASCAACHRLMDPIGLGFESFDGAGKFRATENGRDVDVSGSVEQADAALAGPFNGALELQQKLAQSETVQQCVATQWFRYAYGRGETAADSCNVQKLTTQFASGGYRVRDLLAGLTTTNAFLYRRVTPAAGGGQ